MADSVAAACGASPSPWSRMSTTRLSSVSLSNRLGLSFWPAMDASGQPDLVEIEEADVQVGVGGPHPLAEGDFAAAALGPLGFAAQPHGGLAGFAARIARRQQGGGGLARPQGDLDRQPDQIAQVLGPLGLDRDHGLEEDQAP